MKAKIRQAVKWIMAAIILLAVMKVLLGIFGGPPFQGAHGFRPPHGMGQGQFGQSHMMRGHSFIGGFHWIWTIVTFAFWSGVIVLLLRWFKRKANPTLFHQPISYPGNSSRIKSVDFLDEWEKNQTKPREEQ